VDEVLVGGQDAAISELGIQVREDVRSGELISFPLLFLVLVWAFRGFLLAWVPLIGGAISFFGALWIVRLLHDAGLQFSLLATVPLVGVSLGLSVDYALLLIGRYREEFARDRRPAAALGAARRFVAPTIATSAAAIALALAPLTLMPIPLFKAVGIATGICALFAGATALFVTPLMLGLFGERISSTGALSRIFSPRSRRRGHFWRVVPAFAIRRPGLVMALTVGALLALAAPISQMRIGGISSTQVLENSEAQHVYSILRREFDPTLTQERFELFLKGPGGRTRLDEIVSAVGKAKGIEEVRPAVSMSGTWNIEAIGTGTVGSLASQATAKELRSISDHLYVASAASAIVDREGTVKRVSPRMMSFAGLALFILAFGLLGSFLVPAKLVLLTLLTILSTLGVMVVVFQWHQGITGFGASEIVLLVALVMPLVMDYGLFVASRITEAHRKGAKDAVAITEGLATTGPVVSTAGTVFCVAVAIYASSDVTLVQHLAVGLVIAVLIDTTLVRALLVPAAMTLMGRWNWWTPRHVSALRRWCVRGSRRQGNHPDVDP